MGIVGTLIIGFAWGGWQLGGTVDEMVETASQTARVEALAPICAEKFERAASVDNGLIVKLAAVNSWERDSHLLKTGWATFAGDAEPSNNVAAACAKLLGQTLELK